MENLDLRLNKIRDISFLENLTILQNLDLSSNQITDISFLANMTNLQNEILLLKTKWRTNRKNYRKGMITQEIFDTENQRINEALLAWISAW